MAVKHSERFTDHLGRPWEVQHVLTEGGRRVILDGPHGVYELHPLTQTLEPTRRPCDADTPLPLETP